MKQLFIFLGLQVNVLANAQTISVVYQNTIDTFHYHKVQDVKLYEDNLYILGSKKEEEAKPEIYVLTNVDLDGEVISQNEIPAGKFDFLNSISINSNNIVITGGTWNQNDEGVTDYVALFDSEQDLIWERRLENKWEGDIMSVQSTDGILIATNGNSGVVIYELNSLGRPLNKKIVSSLQPDGLFNLPNSNLLLVTLTINSNGDSQ